MTKDDAANVATFIELAEMFGVLEAELAEVQGAASEDGSWIFPDPRTLSPVQRRVMVRTAFAAIETIIYMVKQNAIRSGSGLSEAERAYCNEEDYDINDTGELTVRPAKIRFLGNLRFAFRVFCKAFSLSNSLDTSTREWAALRQSVRVRDRLTHPRRSSDLNVSDDETRDVLTAYLWVLRQLLVHLGKIPGGAGLPLEIENHLVLMGKNLGSTPG